MIEVDIVIAIFVTNFIENSINCTKFTLPGFDFSRETIKSDVRVETEQGVTASGPRGIFFSQCFSLTSPHLFISNFLSPPPKWTDK